VRSVADHSLHPRVYATKVAGMHGSVDVGPVAHTAQCCNARAILLYALLYIIDVTALP
jgi:hypothetical protein